MDPANDKSAHQNNRQQAQSSTILRAPSYTPASDGQEHAQLEKSGGRAYPRYMTPTAASRAQVSTPEPRASTPPTNLSTGKRKAWMVSAARRVGIVPSTPRSKKEGRVYKRLSPLKAVVNKAGDKLAYEHTKNALGDSDISEAPSEKEFGPTKTDTKHQSPEQLPELPSKDIHELGPSGKPSPPDKPLPSLPIAIVQAGSPLVRRSLIDASEKPLRRSTPPSPAKRFGDEWPTLFPSQSTTPITLQAMGHGISSIQTQSLIDSTFGSKLDHDVYDNLDVRNNRGPSGATSAVFPNPPQGQQEDTPRTGEEVVMQAGQALGCMMGGLKSRKEPHNALEEAGGPPAAAANETCAAETTSETDASGHSRTGEVLYTCEDTLRTSIVNNAPSSQRGRGARGSMLPTRFSTPGPVRSSSSPRRSVSGRSSPYDSIPARMTHAPQGKQDDHYTYTKRPHRAKERNGSQAVHNVDVISETLLPLNAIKQSSAKAQAKGRKSSIPRSRRRCPLPQDAESEGDIFVSSIPRKSRGGDHVANDHMSDDGDLDSDECHEGKVNKVSEASCLSTGDGQLNQAFRNAGPKSDISGEAAPKANFEVSIPLTTSDPRGGDNPPSAMFDNHQKNMSPAADAAAMVGTCIGDSMRGMVDNPFNRLKRLSANAPEHGPVLRISESAERIIMGYGSENDVEDDDTPARKRHSVPDLRRSAVVKELRKSTEGLLNGRLPLSRSMTTRSLTRNESKELFSEDAGVRGPSTTQSPTKCAAFKAEDSISEDPFNTCRREKDLATVTHIKRHTPNGVMDWPLKSFATSPELYRVEEDSAEDGKSWISPLQVPFSATGLEQKSSPIINKENGFQAAESCASSSKESHRRVGDRSDGKNISPPAMGKNSISVISNAAGSAGQKNAQFPPRISSRANTPDVSLRSRAQANHAATQNIPNRFESVHANRNPQGFPLEKSKIVDYKSLRYPIHELTDNERSQIRTPATRETSKGQLSSAKGMLSNFRGLFHKRSTDSPLRSSTEKGKPSSVRGRPVIVAVDGSPHPNNLPQILSASYGPSKEPHGGDSTIPGARDGLSPITASSNPALSDLNSEDFHQATDLAVRILDGARKEHDPLKRARLLQFGQLMVEAVSAARDAEKATEEAKQAAARAEMHYMRTKKNVLELSTVIGTETGRDPI